MEVWIFIFGNWALSFLFLCDMAECFEWLKFWKHPKRKTYKKGEICKNTDNSNSKGAFL